ncbi:hypothetical protein DGN16_22140 [Xanthomonas citri pv. fuscans]|nr:hypothetical protein DGN16_22140 [Xanthomonas citri pv. fuscans]QWN13830.1 hypothetical protein DGN07_22060 [Xanthomonas citri pv. fuscans]
MVQIPTIQTQLLGEMHLPRPQLSLIRPSLEVNEAGQFMFIETWCQSIPLTEAFCQFIERADPQFEYEPVSQPLTLREAYEDAKR